MHGPQVASRTRDFDGADCYPTQRLGARHGLMLREPFSSVCYHLVSREPCMLVNEVKSLTRQGSLYSRSSVLTKPCPVPMEPGAYAWFFKDVPTVVPTDGCLTRNGLTLLYVGISPDRVGKPNSKQNLRKRITNHLRGNASGSTLRRSLGVLLTPQSGLPLRRVGSGKRMTFTHLGEQWLDRWMEENAFVCWLEHQAPWELEQKMFGMLSLPLNIKGNKSHSFSAGLSTLRRVAIKSARDMAIASEDNQNRRVKGEDNADSACPFCRLDRAIIAENEHAIAIRDLFPVSEGHTLVIPRRHKARVDELDDPEYQACWRLVREVVREMYQSVSADGFNIGVNLGAVAGQTVDHAHIHIIPRFDGDVENPRGGVRHVIPGKGYY